MPGRVELIYFLEQRGRIDHHAVADHARDARMQNAAGISLNTNFLPPMYTVCPALCPP